MKDAWTNTKKAQRGFSNSLFWFAFFTLLSLCVAYFNSFTLIITIPFVVLPSYFAFIAISSTPKLPVGETSGFFLMFKTYFNRLFFGCFKVITGILKALAFSFLSSVVMTTIGESVIFKGDAKFESLIQSDADLSESIKLFSEYISQNPRYEKWLFISASVSILVGVLVFIHHIAKNTPKLDFSFYRKQPVPMREFGFIDRKVRHEHKKEFLGRLLKATWFAPLLIILSFGGSFAIEMFLLKGMNVDHVLVIGLAITLILLLPFMNYFAQVFHCIYAPLAKTYEKKFVEMTLEILTRYKEKMGISEEDAKKIEAMVKGEASKEEKEKEKEKKGKK